MKDNYRMVRPFMWTALWLLASLCISSAAYAQDCVPPPSGLISWWTGDGNANDIQGGNDGTLVGDATFAAGKVDQGFSFDGDDDYVEVPHNTSLNLSAFTVDAWVFIDPAANAGEVNIFVGKTTGASVNGGFFLTHDDRRIATPFFLDRTTNGLRFAALRGGTGGFSEAFLKDAFPTPGFYHIAGTFDGNKARLYLDGVLVSTGSIIDAVGFNTLPLRIGSANVLEENNIDDRFEGLIDEVELFGRVLSQAEIQAIVNAESAGKCKVNVIDAIDVLIAKVEALGLPNGLESALLSKLNNAKKSWNEGNANATVGQLGAVINQVKAKRGTGISDADADNLIACAQAIIDAINGGTAAKRGAGEEAAEVATEVPDQYVLHGAYPNPFNPETVIRFALPEAEHVRLVVYDVMGREVARLVDQPLHAGTHSVTWDASGLPSGTYLYRLTAGPFSQTKALTLLK